MSHNVADVCPSIREVIQALDGSHQFLEPAGLDGAIIGLAFEFGEEHGRVCYDRTLAEGLLTQAGYSQQSLDHLLSCIPDRAGELVPAVLTPAASLLQPHTAQSIREAIDLLDGEFLLLAQRDMDSAIVGLVQVLGTAHNVVCYDRDLVIGNLVRDGMDHDEAEEFFAFNIEGAYAGRSTPVFLTSTKTLLEFADLVN